MVRDIINNFKTLLSNNYFLTDDDETAFFKWLFNNLDYTNGVLRVNLNYTSEYSIVSFDGEDDLKDLVNTWCYDKNSKQDYWLDLLDDNVLYRNGNLKFL